MSKSVKSAEMSVFKLYMRQTLTLWISFMLACVLIGVFLYEVLSPVFHDEIFHQIHGNVKSVESEVVSQLLRQEFNSAYKFLDQIKLSEFDERRTLHPFNLDGYEQYGLKSNCAGRHQEFDWGETCTQDGFLLIEVPVKSADNTLAHIQVKVSDSILQWKAFQKIVYCLIFVVLLSIPLIGYSIYRFHRRFAGPVSKSVDEIINAKDLDEFLPIIERMKLKELCDLSRGLFDSAGKLHRANIQVTELKAKEDLGRQGSLVSHDIKHRIATIASLIGTADLDLETKSQIHFSLRIIRERISLYLKRVTAIHKPACQLEMPKIHFSSIGGVILTCIEEFKLSSSLRDFGFVLDVPRKVTTAFVPLRYSESSRLIENIVSNAIHASTMNGSKRVYISAQITDDRQCQVTIRDYGKGFEKDVLNDVLAGRTRTTKKNGHGLGIVSAQQTIKGAGGKLEIHSDPAGSTITLTLPLVEPADWFFNITESSNIDVICLDDDVHMHEKLARIFPNKNVTVVREENEFIQKSDSAPEALLLVDYDFGGRRNGFQLICEERIKDRAILMSGRISLDDEMIEFSEKNEIRMFPKECLG